MSRIRMGYWLLMALAGLGLTWWLAPAMVKVTLYKLSLAPAAAFVYYRLDRAIGENKRPHELLAEADELRVGAKDLDPGSPAWIAVLAEARYHEAWARDRYLRRTILVSAGLIAVALAS